MPAPKTNRLLSATALFLSISTAAAEPSGLLTPSLPVERPLGAGEAHRFHAELEPGKSWLLRVEQRGIDVVVEVTAPDGRSLLAVDSPQGREGTESLLLRPVIAGRHGIEIRSEKRGVPEGRYEIRLEELPAATPGDRLRLRAEEAMTEAGRLFRDDARQRAASRLREAVGAWRSLGETRREAEAWSFLGGLFAELEDYRGSAESHQEALALWRRLGDERGVAAALDRLGLTNQSLGEHPRALAYLEEAVALRRSLGRTELEAETRNHLCLALQRSGRFRAAGACYEETLALARAGGDLQLEGTLLNNLGGIASNLGEPAEHLDYLQQALSLRRSLDDELGEAVTLNNLGAFYRGFGEIEEALRLYGQALAIFERLGNRTWQARTLNNIGYAYLTLGELERARAYLLRALPLRREVGDRAGEAVTLRNLGRAFAGLGEAGKALAVYRRSLDHDLAAGNRRGAATAGRLLGELHLERNEAEAAREELERALASLVEMGNRPHQAEVLELLGRVHLELGESRKARALAVQSLELHRAVRSRVGEVAALVTLARAERALGGLDAVRTHLEAALNALDALQGRLGDPGQKASFLATQRQVYELQVDFLMELHRRSPAAGHDRSALAASERARSRSLLALLGGAAAVGWEVEPALAERLRAAERRFAAKSRRQLEVLGRVHSMEEALAAEQELYAALAELDGVRAEIRRRHPRYASLTEPDILDAAGIQALLDGGTILLEIFLGEERSFLWWVDSESVTAHELPPRGQIEPLAEGVHGQISAIHRRTAKDREALEALGRMLLGPVTDRLEGQRLVVVPDGALHFVPFAALTLPRGREPVVTRHEVVYLPSASVLAAQRVLALRPEPAKTVAIFADPIFDSKDPRVTAGPEGGAERLAATHRQAGSGLGELGRLPHTRREAEAVATLVPEDERLVALGGDATRSRVVGGELADYRILHFATHGLVDPRVPELSGLVLSRRDSGGGELDGFLGFYDVSNLELSAELVVLSGCRTALGKPIRGEGLVGLTRGFLYAGVPRVVASFWQVRDEAAAELMARFYRALLVEKLPAGQALRAAQLALRAERRFRDPYYWAAFGLQGDWR